MVILGLAGANREIWANIKQTKGQVCGHTIYTFFELDSLLKYGVSLESKDIQRRLIQLNLKEIRHL
jgi:hypothetical protein